MEKQDLTDAVAIALAALAVVVQAALLLLVTLALAALFSATARAWFRELRATIAGTELWSAWTIALVATLGSLFFSEVSDFVTCRLCWFQRIAMYPLAVVLLVAALRRDFGAGPVYALAFPVVGGLISMWHIYIEINPDAEPSSCKIGASCAIKWIDELGYVTIPVLALTAFAAILALLLMARARPPDA